MMAFMDESEDLTVVLKISIRGGRADGLRKFLRRGRQRRGDH